LRLLLKFKVLLSISLFLVVILISSCSSNDSIGNSTTTKTQQTGTTKMTGDLKLPEDFPTDIPVHPGEIVVSTASGESHARTWVVEVLVAELESARLKVLSDLNQANFDLQEESGIGTSEYLATLTNSDYLIRLKVYLESDTGQKEVMYIVTRA
jgi:hypothetical protein